MQKKAEWKSKAKSTEYYGKGISQGVDLFQEKEVWYFIAENEQLKLTEKVNGFLSTFEGGVEFFRSLSNCCWELSLLSWVVLN